jgi:transcriptional regulator
MYNLPYHKENSRGVISEFIARYPFAFVVGCNSEGLPIATQIPLFIEEQNGKQLLKGHIMRNTDHHKAFQQNPNVLAVFTGHHVYVSGTWYSNPFMASTWNYMSVHATGLIRFLDEVELEDVLRKTTLHFENYDHASTTIFDNLPMTFKQKVMHAIVAFEIGITNLDNVFKLSQDRDFESYQNIIRNLRQKGESGRVIAEEMEKRTGEVFQM